MGKPIFMLCQTEKEMIFVILTRIFSKPTKPTGEIFVTTMTWATKDKRALVVRLRHQIFYNKQRQVSLRVCRARVVCVSCSHSATFHNSPSGILWRWSRCWTTTRRSRSGA
jgi:hypothetical protein